ncbi:MAG: MFS transporter [Devosia sp.]
MPFFTTQRLVMLVFFLQPIAFGSWLPRIPDIQLAVGLGPQGLALALLGLPCGTLATLPFAGRIVGQIGARRAMLIGFVMHLIAVCLPPFSTHAAFLFVSLIFVGSSMSFLELALNIEAARVEKASGKLIMSTAHGFWSLGIMLGSFIGAALAGVALAPPMAVALIAIVSLPVCTLAARALPDVETATRAEDGERHSPFMVPGWALLGVCLFVFGVTITEGAMADWSAIYLRGVFAADPVTAGIGYTIFALLVAAGRFSGDHLRARLGSVALARAFGVLALVGVALLTLAPNTFVALAGFAIVGIGVSVGFPLAVAAAAALPGASASRNVAVLSFIALLGFLIGPPIIGFIAEHWALRIGLVALLPALALSLVLTGRLAVAKPTSIDDDVPRATEPVL